MCKRSALRFQNKHAYLTRIILDILLDTFSIVFEGWIVEDSHFVSAYAAFPKNRLYYPLAFEDETTEDTNSTLNFSILN